MSGYWLGLRKDDVPPHVGWRHRKRHRAGQARYTGETHNSLTHAASCAARSHSLATREATREATHNHSRHYPRGYSLTRHLRGHAATLLLELRDLAEHMVAQALHALLFGHWRRPVALDRNERTQLFLELLF